MTRGILRV